MDKRKLAVVVSGLVLIGGLSAGAALAQSSGSAPPTSQTTSPGTDSKAEPSEQAESKEGVEQETKGAEEPGDEQLSGGGHADPEGQNVDHQFEGVE